MRLTGWVDLMVGGFYAWYIVFSVHGFAASFFCPGHHRRSLVGRAHIVAVLSGRFLVSWRASKSRLLDHLRSLSCWISKIELRHRLFKQSQRRTSTSQMGQTKRGISSSGEPPFQPLSTLHLQTTRLPRFLNVFQSPHTITQNPEKATNTSSVLPLSSATFQQTVIPTFAMDPTAQLQSYKIATIALGAFLGLIVILGVVVVGLAFGLVVVVGVGALIGKLFRVQGVLRTWG